MNSFIDSHCHLNFPQFKDNLDEIIKRATNSGVKKMITISIKLSQINDLEYISNKYSQVYNSVGIHPHECINYKDLSIDDLLQYTKNPKCVGIGETGLDFYYENSPKNLQSNIFSLHIDAARRSNLPLIVHTRNADKETITILEKEMRKGEFSGLIHCFSAGKELAERAIDLGLYISLSGIVTFNKANDLRNLVKKLPLERLLIETDSPYLAPVPYRGKCNEPSYITYTADFLAKLLNITLDELAQKTTKNFHDIFKKAI